MAVSVPSYRPTPLPRKGVRKHLTTDETRRVLAAARARGLQQYLIIRLLYETALRAGEVSALRWDHCRLLHEKPPRLYLPRGKGSSAGWTPVSAELAGKLQDWLRDRFDLGDRLVRAACARWPQQFVFPGQRRHGKYHGVSRSSVWRYVKELCAEAGVPPSVAHPHALRHGRAMHLFEEAERQGLDDRAALTTVAKLLGHTTAQTAWRYYVTETGRGKAVAEAVFKQTLEDAGPAGK